MKHRLHLPSRRASQRGIVLIFALITLVIMMIGAVAISRSLSSSQFTLGNIGFKRDLTNQGERALQMAMDAVRGSGALASEATRNASLPSANYSATMLPTNAQGIPLALLDSTAFAAVGVSSNDIDVGDGTGIKIRYVIDRMALAAGACSSANCTMANEPVYGGPKLNPPPPPPPEQPVFRLTLRVDGPRKTVSFFQSTFTTN
jgi:type IV pilus assembly protein PilX